MAETRRNNSKPSSGAGADAMQPDPTGSARRAPASADGVRDIPAAISADVAVEILQKMSLLERTLQKALAALDIAKVNADTPQERQEAENSIPAVTQAKSLLGNKINAFILNIGRPGIAPPSQDTIDETMRLAEALAKVDAETQQLKSAVSLSTRVVKLVTSL